LKDAQRQRLGMVKPGQDKGMNTSQLAAAFIPSGILEMSRLTLRWLGITCITAATSWRCITT